MHQPIIAEELEERTKSAMERGKRHVKKAKQKVKVMGKHVLGVTPAAVVADNSSAEEGGGGSSDNNNNAPAADTEDSSGRAIIGEQRRRNNEEDEALLSTQHPNRKEDFANNNEDAASSSDASASVQRNANEYYDDDSGEEEGPAHGAPAAQRRLLPARIIRARPPPTTPPSSSSGGSRKPKKRRDGRPATETMLVVYTAAATAYQAWSYRAEILADRIPSSVVVPFLVVAFLMGYNLDGYYSSQMNDHDDHDDDDDHDDVIIESSDQSKIRGEASMISPRQRGGASFRGTDAPTVTDATQTSVVDDYSEYDRDGTDKAAAHVSHGSRTKQLIKKGKHNFKSFGRRYINPDVVHPNNALHGMAKKQLFWSNLQPHHEEGDAKAPLITRGPLMDYLLKYSDFRRHKEKVVSRGSGAETRQQNVSDVGDENNDTTETEEAARRSAGIQESQHFQPEDTDISERSHAAAIGNAKLHNTNAEELAADAEFAHIVDPVCDLRGMDLFLTDDPPEDIWRQPLLIQSGLRDTPTFIANMMMPFGNVTAYFKMPDWFDDWDNIPEEKEDDPEELKALKRFLLGDNEYRKERCKVVPHIVDGPLAIRLIKPKPQEYSFHGPRHPASWTNVSKSIDPATGKTNAAILECDIDLFSNKAIRKIINIVRPHIASVVVDIAIIISKPKLSEIEEPSACLGLWRIENVDFDECAVFPELGIEEAASQVRETLKWMEVDDMEAHVRRRRQESVVGVPAG